VTIDRCLNPDCRRSPQGLRDGRVVRVLTGKGKREVLKHLWLCGPCYEEYNFAFQSDGEVVLEPRAFGRDRKTTSFAARSPSLEVVEIPAHPFFQRSQARPEFESISYEPHPLFRAFIGENYDDPKLSEN
jgi:hypothetical protein